MPSHLHIVPINDEVRSCMPKEIHDLAIGKGDSFTGITRAWYQAMNIALGGLELAYRRGFQAGQEAEKLRGKRPK